MGWLSRGAEARVKAFFGSRDRAGRLASERDQLAASLRGTKANAARTRKELHSVKARVAHGVCPCCNRTFKQLARHMKTKHPDYVEAAK